MKTQPETTNHHENSIKTPTYRPNAIDEKPGKSTKISENQEAIKK